MNAELRFLGAAGNVTGSRYLLRVGGSTLLIDCGLYQERQFRSRNWDPFSFPPAEIDAILLTHAHVDHCGLIPKLVREGFRGVIYCTAATAQLLEIVLLDSAHIQEEDAEHKRRRHEREGRKGPHEEKPLYTTEDAERSLGLVRPVGYREEANVAPSVTAVFREAGHILGSAMLAVRYGDGGSDGGRTILFSGDIGRWNKPILKDPTLFDAADYVITESTYGDRTHDDTDAVDDLLAEAVTWANERNGNVVIPSFAIGRTQEVLYRLNVLRLNDRIPHLMTFVDSPMAVRVTEVFRQNAELFDEEAELLVEAHKSPFSMPNLKLVSSVAESKSINHIHGTAVILSASGMCTAGRIKHHLVHNIARRESVILFVGYQARGTLGRHILEEPSQVRIFGSMHSVRARVVQIHGFSAHADRNELLRWITALRKKPRRVFVTHGEQESSESYAKLLRQKLDTEVTVPAYEDVAVLD